VIGEENPIKEDDFYDSDDEFEKEMKKRLAAKEKERIDGSFTKESVTHL